MSQLFEVLENIRQDANRLPPDTNLGHLWLLSRTYKAGCSTVSEAMQRLINEGVIEYRRGSSRGYFTKASVGTTTAFRS